jgi:hypothetical protein
MWTPKKQAIRAMKEGASEIRSLRRVIEMQNAQLDMVRILHEITNPGCGRVSHHIDRMGAMQPDICFELERSAEQTEEYWVEPVKSDEKENGECKPTTN